MTWIKNLDYGDAGTFTGLKKDCCDAEIWTHGVATYWKWFWDSENLLLNNRTHLYFAHIFLLLGRNWHFGIQTELVFWSIFGVILSKKMHVFSFYAKFWSEWHQKMTQNQKISKFQNTSSVCIPKSQFLAKNEKIWTKWIWVLLLRSKFLDPPNPGISHTFREI